MKNPSRKSTPEERINMAAWHRQQQQMALQRATNTDYHRFTLLKDFNGRQEWRNAEDGKIWRTWITRQGTYTCEYYRIDANYLARREREEQKNDFTA